MLDLGRTVFSRLGPLWVRVCAASGTLALASLFFWLVGKGSARQDRRVPGERPAQAGDRASKPSPPWKKPAAMRVRPVLDALFLEGDTASYSLSKFQLLAWTPVAISSYLYLFFARALIQCSLTFPNIPEGWPTLLGMSAGASIIAVGVTATRGPKGAGTIGPSSADLVSSGGLVTGDRVQFFLWRLGGCTAFLFLVLLQDPSGMKELPKLPRARPWANSAQRLSCAGSQPDFPAQQDRGVTDVWVPFEETVAVGWG